ncbi:MAG: helix-turn-helix transcriptional regulator [Deltaproteobacteria bacterium]|nr:helix-turn-helix transcriptional regulator [Deltaproteobacteria bacterium]
MLKVVAQKKTKAVAMDKKQLGSTLESLFEETGELAEIRERVSKRIFADQLRVAMQRKKISQSEMARRMNTSRSAVLRVLDPAEPGVTLETLVRASAAVGMNFEPRLVAVREVSVSVKVMNQRKHAIRR